MSLTSEERAVCAQMQINESDYARTKAADIGAMAGARAGLGAAHERGPGLGVGTGLGAVLNASQREVCRQMKIDPSTYAASLAEDNPSLFVAQASRVRLDASALTDGIRSGTRIELRPGSETHGVARGALTFKPSGDDGLLRSGDYCEIEPGYSGFSPGDGDAAVRGTISYLGSAPDSLAEPRVIQDGDAVLIGETMRSGCHGKLTLMAEDAAASKAKALLWFAAERTAAPARRLAKLEAERAALRADIKAMRRELDAKKARKAKAKASATRPTTTTHAPAFAAVTPEQPAMTAARAEDRRRRQEAQRMSRACNPVTCEVGGDLSHAYAKGWRTDEDAKVWISPSGACHPIHELPPVAHRAAQGRR